MPYVPVLPAAGRPENPKYRSSDLPDTQPTLIFKNGNFTYLCWLYGDETKNDWKICRVQTVFNAFERIDYNPILDSFEPFDALASDGTIAYLYPYGSASYNFHPKDVNFYGFTFAR